MNNTALLDNNGLFTSFTFGNKVIRFRTSAHLVKYTRVLEWDNGYIVVMAQYDNSPDEEEEYIDLIPILENLYIEPEDFLRNIKEVKIKND